MCDQYTLDGKFRQKYQTFPVNVLHTTKNPGFNLDLPLFLVETRYNMLPEN